MSKVKNMNVVITDEDHVYINDRPFISLKRFVEAREEVAENLKVADDKNKELVEENEALKVLLEKFLF